MQLVRRINDRSTQEWMQDYFGEGEGGWPGGGGPTCIIDEGEGRARSSRKFVARIH